MARSSSRPNLVLMIGIGLIVLFAIFLVMFLGSLRPSSITVLVPKDGIPAYRAVTADMMEKKDILNEKSLPNVLTAADFAELTKDGKEAYTLTNLRPGQLVYKEDFGANKVGSYQVVSPDERVVAVTTSFQGAIAGTLKPGDVVDVAPKSGYGDQAGATFAKVIAIGDGATVSKGISGKEVSEGEAKPGEAEAGKTTVILSVADGESRGLAGQEVAMTLLPFCRVVLDPERSAAGGIIEPAEGADPASCTPPAERAAAGGQAAVGEG